MNTLGNLQGILIEYAEGIRQNLILTVKRCAIAADAALVIRTPVDTGRAKSNWIVTVGEPSNYSIVAYRAGKAGSTSGENSRAALEHGNTVIATYSGQPGGIFITNNLTYIGRLNNGYSKQAPANFVEAAVIAAIRKIADVSFIKRVRS